MTIHLFLDIIISIGIVLALTRSFFKPGLLLLGIGFLAKAMVAFGIDKDMVQGFIGIIVVSSILYEYSKMVRHAYSPTKHGRIMAGGLFILLGAWMTAIGTFSPFLIAGLVSVFIILAEDFVLPKKPARKT